MNWLLVGLLTLLIGVTVGSVLFVYGVGTAADELYKDFCGTDW